MQLRLFTLQNLRYYNTERLNSACVGPGARFQGRYEMNKAEIYDELEKEFVSTFTDELIPGVLHNFANPLNSIMGRSKLLQRRYANFLREIDERGPGLSQELGEDKISRDINTIASEAERFFAIFRDIAGKFSVLAAREPERINLSQMIEAELRFYDFYLDFKHELKKNFHLDPDLPEITGPAAEYSRCISTLFNSAKDRMKGCPAKEISIATSFDAQQVSIMIQDKGVAISAACEQIWGEKSSGFDAASLPETERGLFHALSLLKLNGARLQVHGENGQNKIEIRIPYC